MYEGLLVWSSKLGMDGMIVWASKPDMNDFVLWASKPSAMGLIGIGHQHRGVADRHTRSGISKLVSRRNDVEKVPGPLD